MRRIQLRRDTLANFEAVNPVLKRLEPAYTTDTKRIYVGDGKKAFKELKPVRKVEGT